MAFLSVCRSPLTSILNCPNPFQPYKLNIQSVATAPADNISLLSLKSTRFMQFEAALPLPKYICRCRSQLTSNSSSEGTSGTKRAFISVSDKSDLAFLGSGLHNLGYTIVSTGGTALSLENDGVPLMKVEQLTAFPELFDGPVKTLHPYMGAGARRDSKHHMESLKDFRIGTFDVVVLNFNPFYDKISSTGGGQYKGVELIDTRGPGTILAVAKNFKKVLVVVDPQDYRSLLEYLQGEQDDQHFHKKLAHKAIQHVIVYYDAAYERKWKHIGEG